MFNSCIDGTKSGIEMTAVCNATGLVPPPDGLGFPPVPAAEAAKGQIVTWADVEVDSTDPTVAFRREMEKIFAPTATK